VQKPPIPQAEGLSQGLQGAERTQGIKKKPGYNGRSRAGTAEDRVHRGGRGEITQPPDSWDLQREGTKKQKGTEHQPAPHWGGKGKGKGRG